MKSFKVSIIVPIYNVGSYIFQCVQSILSQTYNNIEVILVNDGSTDDSLVFCKTFSKEDKRIILINQPNQGLVKARQAGLSVASGEYILNVDGDDWLAPDCIEYLLRMAVLHDAEIVIPGYFREFVGMRDTIKPNYEEGLYDANLMTHKIYPTLISNLEPFSHGISTYSWGKLFLKDLIYNIQMSVPSSVTIAEDSVVTYPVIAACKRLVIAHNPVYYYRQRAMSMLKMVPDPINELKKLKQTFRFLSDQLRNASTYNFTSQIEVYRVAISCIRTGCFFDKKNIAEDLFSTHIDFKNKKIALYSSGSFGQIMYNRMLDSKIDIVGWFDHDYAESQSWGWPVMPPEKLRDIHADVLLIATLDPSKFNIYSSILKEFTKKGCIHIHPILSESSLKKWGYYLREYDCVKNKKLLIMGGNPETASLVKVANGMGVISVVADPDPLSPAKKVASQSYDIDCLDINAMSDLIEISDFDGILVGVADILVSSYYQLCKRHGFPTYATPRAIEAFGSKDGFINACNYYGIKVIPHFTSNLKSIIGIDESEYPLLIKPVDSGAGVGISVCSTQSETKEAIKFALEHSKVGRVLVERYMDCDDILVYYTFVEGKAILSASADRHKSRSFKGGSPVCIGATYPSKHQNKFIEEVHPKLSNMFKDLKIKNGVLLIQLFRDHNNFYAYDPGFRLQGEAPHIHILHSTGIDQRKMLIEFALTGSASSGNQLLNTYVGHNAFAVTAWVLLKPGKIMNISGLDIIKNCESYVEVVQRFIIGDIVTDSMVDTEKQVFARFYFQHEKMSQLKNDIKSFRHVLIVEGDCGNMISDIFDENFF